LSDELLAEDPVASFGHDGFNNLLTVHFGLIIKKKGHKTGSFFWNVTTGTRCFLSFGWRALEGARFCTILLPFPVE